MVSPRPLIDSALQSLTGPKNCLDVVLAGRKFEDGSPLDFFWLTVSFKRDRPKLVATLPLSEERAGKLARLAADARAEGLASVASLRKLAGKFCFAGTAMTGRFCRAASKPIYNLIASGEELIIACNGGIRCPRLWCPGLRWAPM